MLKLILAAIFLFIQLEIAHSATSTFIARDEQEGCFRCIDEYERTVVGKMGGVFTCNRRFKCNAFCRNCDYAKIKRYDGNIRTLEKRCGHYILDPIPDNWCK
ncbi:hypothetical protein BCR42DRAFT_398369 [Absidia repens]|uniref:Uncharacterized protein n=1 Tax=Absidia repens TaxID=90262 RepID=A0A1X2HYQ4_9FUNG|nr:hypothetical protein BCR42DRAFT_398369 [Absidia repens]